MAVDPAALKYWVGFSRIPGVGRARLALLEQAFGSLGRAWEGSAAELHDAGLDRRTIDSILKRRDAIDLDAEMARMEQLGVRALTWHDPDYPPLLREIYDVPPLIYVRGTLLPEDRTAVAVVGTRKATVYGREATVRLVSELARAGITIVSGLARGIDTAAHRTALEQGGRTIAVMAGGLESVYPSENLGLAKEIIKHGALVSEHPLGTRPEASHFPRRNRILSGLSLGVLVVEATPDSGALITARCAWEQDRDVFAVPGSIFSPGSQGTHRWIQEGAKLVTRAEDILEELNVAALGQQLELEAAIPANELEGQLLKHISRDPAHIDEVRRQSGLPIADVSSALITMELKGLVRHVGGMNYVLAR